MVTASVCTFSTRMIIPISNTFCSLTSSSSISLSECHMRFLPISLIFSYSSSFTWIKRFDLPRTSSVIVSRFFLIERIRRPDVFGFLSFYLSILHYHGEDRYFWQGYQSKILGAFLSVPSQFVSLSHSLYVSNRISLFFLKENFYLNLKHVFKSF